MSHVLLSNEKLTIKAKIIDKSLYKYEINGINKNARLFFQVFFFLVRGFWLWRKNHIIYVLTWFLQKILKLHPSLYFCPCIIRYKLNSNNNHKCFVDLILALPITHYASPSSGEAYRDRRLTTNFEFWVEIFCVPTCFHVRILKLCLSVRLSVHLSVPREKKSP